MSDLYADLTKECQNLLHELNAARVRIVELEARLDESEKSRYVLMGEVVESRQRLTSDYIVISKLNQDREKLQEAMCKMCEWRYTHNMPRTLDDIPAPDWHRAALIAGEYMATKGPNNYYRFTPTEWLEWMIDSTERERLPLTLTDRGDAADGYHAEVEP